MRLAPYYAYTLMMFSSAAAGASVLALLRWDVLLLAVAALAVAGFHIGVVGAAIASDWRGAMRQLRAVQRVHGRKHGRAWRWICRDGKTEWRMAGLVFVAFGFVYIALAVQIART